MSLKTLEYVPGILGVNNSRGGSRTAATSKIELFMIIKKEAVNFPKRSQSSPPWMLQQS